MKVYSIGRENGCDIVINDPTDVISRRHAILNVSSTGKMTIVDQSHNGTYVNGIRISSNVPVPVTRKDSVSFAHIARLDWNIIPKSYAVWKYVGIALAAIVVVIAIVLIIASLSNSKSTPTPTGADPTAMTTDTFKTKAPDEAKQPEEEKKDDKKADDKKEQDKPAKKDSDKDKKSDTKDKKDESKDTDKDKKDEKKDEKKDDTEATTVRPRG